MPRTRRSIWICECAWNKCTLRSWKEPRKCVCEQNNPAVNWVKHTSPGQQAIDRGGYEKKSEDETPDDVLDALMAEEKQTKIEESYYGWDAE